MPARPCSCVPQTIWDYACQKRVSIDVSSSFLTIRHFSSRKTNYGIMKEHYFSADEFDLEEGVMTMEYTIRPLPPFDFFKMLQRISSTGKTSCAYIDAAAQTYRRQLRINDKIATMEVTFQGEADQPVLHLRVPQKLSYNEQNEVVNLARRMFSIDTDLHKFYNHLSQIEALKPLIEPNYGLRLILDPTLFECLMKTIISQQLNLAFAGTLIDRFIQLCANVAGHSDSASSDACSSESDLLPFPTPEQTAALSYDQLRELGFSQRKAEYVIDTARLIAEGALDLEGLRRKPEEEVMETLLPIRGIGRWTVECLLLFGMGRSDILPAADIGLRNAVRKAYGMDQQPTEQEVRELGREWSPWQTYTTLYLWESLKK